jgi:hypothetical protein
LSAVCWLVAGIVATKIHTSEFTLEWHHSVEKTRWEERYRVDGMNLLLISASIEAMGAGMEPPSDANFANGRWTWEPMRSLTELRLTESPYTRDYVVCWQKQCNPLSTIVHSGTGTVTVRPC